MATNINGISAKVFMGDKNYKLIKAGIQKHCEDKYEEKFTNRYGAKESYDQIGKSMIKVYKEHNSPTITLKEMDNMVCKDFFTNIRPLSEVMAEEREQLKEGFQPTRLSENLGLKKGEQKVDEADIRSKMNTSGRMSGMDIVDYTDRPKENREVGKIVSADTYINDSVFTSGQATDWEEEHHLIDNSNYKPNERLLKAIEQEPPLEIFDAKREHLGRSTTRNLWIFGQHRDHTLAGNRSRYKWTARADGRYGFSGYDIRNIKAINVTSVVLPRFSDVAFGAQPGNAAGSLAAQTMTFPWQCLLVDLEGFNHIKYSASGHLPVSSVMIPDTVYTTATGRPYIVFKPAHDEKIEFDPPLVSLSDFTVSLLNPMGQILSNNYATDGELQPSSISYGANNTIQFGFSTAFTREMFSKNDRIIITGFNRQFPPHDDDANPSTPDIIYPPTTAMSITNQFFNREEGHVIEFLSQQIQNPTAADPAGDGTTTFASFSISAAALVDQFASGDTSYRNVIDETAINPGGGPDPATQDGIIYIMNVSAQVSITCRIESYL